MKPKSIKVSSEALSVVWHDETNSEIKLYTLRKNCPCAVCTSLPDGSNEMKVRRFTADQLKIASVSIVGNYALNIVWNDGHRTGIYEFGVLKNLTKNNL